MIKKVGGEYKVLSEKGKNLAARTKPKRKRKSVSARWNFSSTTSNAWKRYSINTL